MTDTTSENCGHVFWHNYTVTVLAPPDMDEVASAGHPQLNDALSMVSGFIRPGHQVEIAKTWQFDESLLSEFVEEQP